MKKMRLFLLLFAAALSVGSFTACSDDDETDAPVTTDYASAIAGEYVGYMTIKGYTGSVSTVLSFSKRNSTTVEMVLDSDELDFHSIDFILNVSPLGDGVYAVSADENFASGTVTGNSCSVTVAYTDTPIFFQGTRR